MIRVESRQFYLSNENGVKEDTEPVISGARLAGVPHNI